MGNIEYDTKKKGEDILSRRRRLLSTIWMKFVPVAPRYPEFRLGGKKFAFKLPKVPDLAKYVKKRQKLFYCFGNLKSEGLKFCIEFAYSFRQTLGKSDSKKTIKNRDQIFIDLYFQLLNNFHFSDYVTDTPISAQLWAGPFNSFVISPGRESPHTLQPSYSPTPFYR